LSRLANGPSLVLVGLALVAGAISSDSSFAQQPQRQEPKTDVAKPPPGQSPAGKNDTSIGKDEQARTREILQSTAPVHLSQEQRQKIQNLMAHTPQEQRVFPATIGAGVPKQIQLFDLPLDVADSLHGYTGDKYLVMRDQMIIVDPQVRRVVAILPGTSS
jgi:Protein of unknown function (DUF1236)